MAKKSKIAKEKAAAARFEICTIKERAKRKR